MSLNSDQIKIIFGLKLKELRKEKKLSLQELNKLSGLSMSYINEIEKGKKYPKADKIFALAKALEVDYDHLVSLKLDSKLEPISHFLNSKTFTDIPFDYFGVDQAQILEMLSDAPLKMSAFINTIIKICNSYSYSVEQLYFSMLRSYQEMHNNYFQELEDKAALFTNKLDPSNEKTILEHLTKTLGISISFFDEFSHPDIVNIRSIYLPKRKNLMVNRNLTSDQRTFTYAKEIGFHYLQLKPRPFTSSWLKVDSFEEVLNNFKASYFAGAILINKTELTKDLSKFFNSTTFEPSLLEDMLVKYKATPETLFYRINNILTDYFKIKKIFFLRFESIKNSKDYILTKEIHLNNQHDPQEVKSENYCRRWVSLKILDELTNKQIQGTYNTPIIDAQISDYLSAKKKYFVLSIARPLHIVKENNISVTLGFELDSNLLSKVKFLKDPKIKSALVNQTCEKCELFDCQDRVAAPIVLQKKQQIKAMKNLIDNLK